MDTRSVTVGLPVRDLTTAIAWYRRVFELTDPDLAPAHGVVEFQLGPVWLQLVEGPVERTGAGVTTRFGVADVRAERDRVAAAGVEIAEVTTIPGVIAFVEFTDPDGNELSLYTEL